MATLIHAEHDMTLDLLNRLERATGKRGKDTPIDPSTPDGKALLHQVVATCNNDVHRHFEFEETRLFPHILSMGGECMVNILSAEHEQIRPIASGLRDLAKEAMDVGSFAPKKWGEFCQLSRDLIDIETFHIQKEEMGLIGALQSMFTPEQDEALANEYSSIQQP